MSHIRTKPSTSAYRDGWDRVFGEKESSDESDLIHDLSAVGAGDDPYETPVIDDAAMEE